MSNSAIAAWKESVARAGGDATSSSAACLTTAAALLTSQAKEITDLKKAATDAKNQVKTVKTQGETSNAILKAKMLKDIKSAQGALNSMIETIRADASAIKEGGVSGGGGGPVIVQHHPVAGPHGPKDSRITSRDSASSRIGGNGNVEESYQNQQLQEQQRMYFAQHYPLQTQTQTQPWQHQPYYLPMPIPHQQHMYHQQQRSAGFEGFQMPLAASQQMQHTVCGGGGRG